MNLFSRTFLIFAYRNQGWLDIETYSFHWVDGFMMESFTRLWPKNNIIHLSWQTFELTNIFYQNNYIQLNVNVILIAIIITTKFNVIYNKALSISFTHIQTTVFKDYTLLFICKSKDNLLRSFSGYTIS